MSNHRLTFFYLSLALLGLAACSSSEPQPPGKSQLQTEAPEAKKEVVVSQDRPIGRVPVAESVRPSPSLKPNAPMGPGTAGPAGAAGQGSVRYLRASSKSRARAARRPMGRRGPREKNHAGDSYDKVGENAVRSVADAPLSTFGVDVDLASYTNVRRFLKEGRLPPPAAVRVEEMVNYFHYPYPQPAAKETFAVTTERGPCPWQRDQQLLLIGLQARRIPASQTPPRNLVFLVDVSGSMGAADKLGLVKKALKRLVRSLNKADTVAVVTYAGRTGTALQPTRGDNQAVIINCIDSLGAGGSTNGAGGILAAYALAKKNFQREHMNRVILVTDGDFNVGVSSKQKLTRLIEKQRDSGVFLTVVGVGRGNLRSDRMSALAKHGNGQFLYMDGEQEAVRQFEQGIAGTLITVAKDVKLQVAFDARRVRSYRLIGYARRQMTAQQFRDDKVDSGELGAGHAVTALYQLEMVKAADPTLALGEVRLRFKAPWSEVAREQAQPIPGRDSAGDRLGFAAAVAGFGMVLAKSEHAGQASLALVEELAQAALGADLLGKRQEFVDLVRRAKALRIAPAAAVGGAKPPAPGGVRRGG